MVAKDNNLVLHPTKITPNDRNLLKGHSSFAIWFTGLSGSGKSTLANELEKRLYENRYHSYILDGDNVRMGLNKDLGFSEEDRKENLRRVGEVARLFIDASLITIAAFISPYKADRDLVYSMFNTQDILEIYVKCPLEECERRDTKGLYRRARNGEIRDFTGISSAYEEPLEPHIIVETMDETIDESVLKIMNYLIDKGYVHKRGNGSNDQ